MIKYHGTPFSPVHLFEQHMKGKNILIPFSRRDTLKRALKSGANIIFDNGAYTLWKQGKKVDWDKYYDWVKKHYERITYFIIPDVIDGTELENNNLIKNYYSQDFDNQTKAVPVWHVAESFERLQKLMNSFDYVAFGSSGEFQVLGTSKWHSRMHEVMKFVCDETGTPKIKIHMLRCLKNEIFTKYPFYSGDSVTVARNHKDYGEGGVVKLLNNIEPFNSPNKYKYMGLNRSPFSRNLFD